MTRKDFDKFKQVISQMSVPVEVQLEALLAIKEHCLNHIGGVTEMVNGDCETCGNLKGVGQGYRQCDKEICKYEPCIPTGSEGEI